MTTSIEAVYEGGVFRPTRKVALTEGTHVEVIVPLTAPVCDPKAAAAKLAQIAAATGCTGQPETSSVDYDQILYTDRNQP